MSLTVSVDGRALDAPELRSQGTGRYARGLLGELPGVAAERGGRLVVLRRRRRPFTIGPAQLLDQLLLPLDLARARGAVHHSLALYGTPLVAPVPRVVTLHDVIPLRWPEHYLRTGIVHKTLYRAVRRAAAVLCVSSAAREDILRHLPLDPERLHVVPEAAEERFRPTDDAAARERLGIEGPYLLYLGVGTEPHKGVDKLVEAFARSDRPETLVLAGEMGGMRGHPNVLLPGFVPEELLPGLISGASCLVTATLYEGFGLPALEAIACGTPVAAYDSGAIPEVAGPGALLAKPGDANALVRAAGRICDEPELAARLSEAGRRHAAGFSWRRTAELTWDAYERAASVARP